VTARKTRARHPDVAPPILSDFLRSKLRRTAIALICAKFALIPVVFDPGSDVPFSVIKALLGHGLAYVLAGVLVALVVRYGAIATTWSWVHVPVIAFLAANVVATIVAVDQTLALYGAHTRMGGLGSIADCALLYFAITFVVRTRQDILALAVSFLAGGAVVLAYEFVQLIGKDPVVWQSVDPAVRPFSTIGQTTNLAQYLIVSAMGAAALAIVETALAWRTRAFLVLWSGLAVIGTVVTQTRSALLGVVVGGALLIALAWAAHPHPRARMVSAIGAAGVAAAFGLVLFVTPLGGRLLSTVESPGATEGDSGLRLESAADTRVALYRIAFNMVRDRPAFGVGPDNFLPALPRYRSDAEPFEVQDNPTSSAHSWVAQVAVTSGLLGLAAFVTIAALAVASTFRSGFHPTAWAAVAMMGAFLGAGLTTVNAIATDWLFWAAVGIVVVTTPTRSVQPAEDRNPGGAKSKPRRIKTADMRARVNPRLLIGYACVGVGVALALTTVSAIDASRAAKASQLARLQGNVGSAIEAGLRATRADPQRPQYWATLGLAYLANERVADAVVAFERASKIAPYDVRYDGDLARAYAVLVQLGDKTAASRASDVADRAVRTDPNNPIAHQTRAVVLQVTGNLPEALKSSQRALALDRPTSSGITTHRDFYVTGIQLLTALGRPVEAVALAHLGMARLADDSARLPIRFELSRSLLANGQGAEALAEIDAVLALRPNDPNAQQLRARILAALAN
jgi:cytochrome c-type biogenesis protein CcmH/NrfG/O-antigen ligase